jgi:hypothetical protein
MLAQARNRAYSACGPGPDGPVDWTETGRRNANLHTARFGHSHRLAASSPYSPEVPVSVTLPLFPSSDRTTAAPSPQA